MDQISIQNRNDAYHSLTAKNKQQQRIISALKDHGRLSINDLSRLLKLPSSTVSGRINELKPNVMSFGKKVDHITNKSVTIWEYSESENHKRRKQSKLKLVLSLLDRYPCDLADKIRDVL